jgi:hypothetical protein
LNFDHHAPRRTNRGCLAAILMVPMISTAQIAPAPETVPAIWRTQTVDFKFRSERQRFRCEEFGARLARIVGALGVHLNTQTQLRCHEGAVSGELTFTSPIEATQANFELVLKEITAADKLAARLNRKPDPGTQIRVFPAQWTHVSSKPSRLHAADCELLSAIERQLLPVLTLRNAEVSAACAAHKIPTLRAVALVRVNGSPIDAEPTDSIATECTQADPNKACKRSRDEAIDPAVLPAG